MLTLKVENLDKLRNAFAKMPAKVAPALQRATLGAGKALQKREVSEAPHKTGTLQRSIRLSYKPIMIELEPMIDYAKYLVGGTGIYGQGSGQYLIYPTRARALRFRGKDGQIHFAKVVKSNGIPPNDFVGRTIVGGTKEVNDLFDKALDEILSDLK